MSWRDLDLIFDLTFVTLTFKILSAISQKSLYVENCYLVGTLLRGVSLQRHGVTLI